MVRRLILTAIIAAITAPASTVAADVPLERLFTLCESFVLATDKATVDGETNATKFHRYDASHWVGQYVSDAGSVTVEAQATEKQAPTCIVSGQIWNGTSWETSVPWNEVKDRAIAFIDSRGSEEPQIRLDTPAGLSLAICSNGQVTHKLAASSWTTNDSVKPLHFTALQEGYSMPQCSE